MSNLSNDELAKIVWDYMTLHEKPKKSDGIFCLGSHDTRVAERATELLLQGYGEYIVFSGGAGRLTKGTFTKSEAEVFSDIAIGRGVDPNKIFLDDKSTNTGENITYTYELLKTKGLPYRSLILVQKPYMERRAYATFKKSWPHSNTTITVTSPQLNFEHYTTGSISKEDVINVMVGDVQRIKEYPRFGYQIEQEIPENVWAAYLELVERGFTEQLIT
jgi:uncharacterized SAM-binding protein YcdF (DUF218 family)